VELVSEETFEPIAKLSGTALLLVAAYVGAVRPTRLIDNLLATPEPDNRFRVTL
jgi:hypothetical protein